MTRWIATIEDSGITVDAGRTLQLTVVIPTLMAGEPLRCCLQSLTDSATRDLQVIVVDNSGENRAVEVCRDFPDVELIANDRNQGFGAAVNRGWRLNDSSFVASLNDDAVVAPDWAGNLLQAARTAPAQVGLWACRVMLDESHIDSAGMVLARDGSSRQRGHLQAPHSFVEPGESLCPSGSAAMYRRTMLEEIGFFEEDFFLYCEDTDLGLRAQWAGWRCQYVPTAVVYHRYSATAGRASSQKAYLVERNRLRVVARNFPASWVLTAPWFAAARYGWHLWDWWGGQGKAAEYRATGQPAWKLGAHILQAHWDTLMRLPALFRQREQIRRRRRISSREFIGRVRSHQMSVRQVAAL